MIGSEKMSEKLALAESTLERVGQWIVAADQKASFLLAFAGVLVGAGLLQYETFFAALDVSKHGALYRTTVFLSIVAALVCTVICIGQVLLMGWPDAKARGTSLFFFGSIRARPIDDYVSAFLAQDEEQAVRDLAEQIHINSEIAARKHERLATAFRCMFVGLSAWAVLFLVLLWAKEAAGS
jgi:hypothetical protein